jgi:hypothetical protein
MARPRGAPNRLTAEGLVAFEHELTARTDEDVRAIASLAVEELRRRGLEEV